MSKKSFGLTKMAKQLGVRQKAKVASKPDTATFINPVYVRKPDTDTVREPATMTTTGLHVPVDLLELAQDAARWRARQRGGRPSFSALVVDLLERHRAELRRDADAYLTSRRGK